MMSIPNHVLRMFLISVACISGAVSTAAGQEGNASGWSITPYIWASDTTVDLTFRDTNIGAGDISFSDLLDVLDAAFMVQIEGGKGNWSAFADLTYLSTSDVTERTVFTIDVDSKQTFLDAAVAYWPAGVGSQFSVFGGLRYSGFDDRFAFSLTANGMPVSEQRSTKDYYDVLVGLRYRFDLSERWALLTHGDLSGGDSEGSFLVRGNFAYTVGKRQQNRILFGYQYKEAEFKDGDLTTDYSYHGPMAGFDFRF